MGSDTNNNFDYNAQVSSDIENIINNPVSFSFCDDFFVDECPNVNYVPVMVEPLVNKDTDYSDSEVIEPVRKKISEENTEISPKKVKEEVKKAPSYSSPKLKYEFVSDRPEKELKPEPKFTFEPEEEKNIFGEKRDDADFVMNYDVNRLYDIQREISVLAGAIQRYQATQSRIMKEENIQRRKEAGEIAKKKEIIDSLVSDIENIYENLKIRERIIKQREENFIENVENHKHTAEEVREEAKPAQKPDKAEVAYTSFEAIDEAEKLFTKPEDHSFDFDGKAFGLSNDSVSAINKALKSMKN